MPAAISAGLSSPPCALSRFCSSATRMCSTPQGLFSRIIDHVHPHECISVHTCTCTADLPLDDRSDDIAQQAASLNGLHSTPPNRLMSGWCSEKCLACNIPTWLSPDPRYWKQSLRSLVAEKGCDFPRTISLGGFCCTSVTCGASGALLLCRC
jgi:hypothetical protein